MGLPSGFALTLSLLVPASCCPHPAALFIEIKRAYELLGDASERAAFDQKRNARNQRIDRFRRQDAESQQMRLGEGHDWG